MNAIRMGRLFGFLLVAVVVVGTWAVQTVRKAWMFSKVDSVVERVEPACYLLGEVQESAGDCLEAEIRGKATGKAKFHATRIRTRYRSPADSQQHSGEIVTLGAADGIVPGRHWGILAHKKNPGEILEDQAPAPMVTAANAKRGQ